MKIIQVHNKYRLGSGENIAVEAISELLKRRGGQIFLLMRNSCDIATGLSGKLQAFVSGIYSPSAYRTMSGVIRRDRPDLIHVHNLCPLFSPSMLVACGRAKVPVVMTCHNYRLMCPTGLHLYDGRICERCCDGREYWCILKNCRGDIFESIAYALRSAVARKLHLFADNVTVFISPTEFLKRRLVTAGIKVEQIVILPNMVSIPTSGIDPSAGQYIAYVGRISPEKGIDMILGAAARLPQLPVRLAGDWSLMPELLDDVPRNATFLGSLNGADVTQLYRKARFLILPSKCFEVCPMVILEAMSYGLPVIASRIGGLSEIVEDGVTGLLFEPGSAEDLAEKMNLLWENPDLCRKMGLAGREKAIREYSEEVYYRRIMAIYEKAIEINKEKLCAVTVRLKRGEVV